MADADTPILPDSPSWPVPLGEVRTETTASNSRFIATLAPAPSVPAARDFIARMRAEFPDATHHVPAFVVGGGNACTEYCSDDGEPSGTSGRPVLTVLRGSGLGNAVLVVTRYFGGTLLGTGGLVKAYTEAAQAVLALCPRGRQEAVHQLMLALPYGLLDRFRLLLGALGGTMEEETFGEDVTLVFLLPCRRREDFLRDLGELGNGRLEAEVMDTRMDVVPL